MSDSKIPQSNSQIKREARLINQGQRQFGGKFKDFKDNQERHFYQRMLKAYIRGNATFQFGLDKDTRKPVWYNVQLTDKSVNANDLDALLAKGYTYPGNSFSQIRGKGRIKKMIRKREADRLEAEAIANQPKKKSILQKIGLKK